MLSFNFEVEKYDELETLNNVNEFIIKAINNTHSQKTKLIGSSDVFSSLIMSLIALTGSNFESLINLKPKEIETIIKDGIFLNPMNNRYFAIKNKLFLPIVEKLFAISINSNFKKPLISNKPIIGRKIKASFEIANKVCETSYKLIDIPKLINKEVEQNMKVTLKTLKNKAIEQLETKEVEQPVQTTEIKEAI